ncbi:hypothetical protein DIC66_16540 [Rhodoferax lacus]|uniref:Ice-binding protein C-terminal domain-containing protein n=1 Tax=Rhodoferax lacus TaxID=2184758 RepID=A0A3E1R8W2_9BURK|nr:PEP-CTERM sorting domain-containing protein [Rhodoferax lacus]RFO95795.1 hypothetical protein DIC66_16540 [Rhodoferax lacus]
MKNLTTFKSIFVLAALSLSAGFVSAADGKQCFEDGLKTPWRTPVKNIDLGHNDDKPGHSDDRNEGHHGDKTSFEYNGHHFHDKDHGGISVSPVSEPATDAMLLAGLVMVGTLARRKPKSLGAALSA